MTVERRIIHLPRPVYSEDGTIATVGLPEGHPVPRNVTQCGDGLHVFLVALWGPNDDWQCECGDREPGVPCWSALQQADRVIIPDQEPEPFIEVVTDEP